jgi:anti-sigma-K factor RskA
MSGSNPDVPEDDMSGWTALYALDALEEPERVEFEAALARHPEWGEEIAGFRATGAALSSLRAEPAPAGLRESVMAKVAGTRQDAPVVELAGRRPAARTWLLRAAAAVVLVGLGGVVGYFVAGDGGSGVPPATTDLASVMTRPDARTFTLEGEAGRMQVVYSATAGRAVLVGGGMEPLPTDTTLELWREVDHQMVSAGVFRPDADGTVELGLDLDLSDTASLNVTVEPAGGSRVPTLPVVLSGPV